MYTNKKISIPIIKPLDDLKLPLSINYIGCAGFEDRATSSLDYMKMNNININKAICIKYKPFNRKNRVKILKNKVENLGGKIKWCFYNRYDPENFEQILPTLLNWNEIDNIVVDISGMSKMLIMILLHNLKMIYKNILYVLYSEAEIYHPTLQEYNKEMKNSIPKMSIPIFLTSEIYKIITTPSLSSVSMQGYPILLITYPTFNYLELITLHIEISPQKMILIEGEPLNTKDKWRLNAIKEINKTFIDSSDVNSESCVLTTFDHIPNLQYLQELYKKYRYTHKILLSPTGSKLQTIACHIFKQLYPEIQIVYPVTKAFIGEYSEGCRRLWGLDLSSFLN
jgi:hypothetical protein